MTSFHHTTKLNLFGPDVRQVANLLGQLPPRQGNPSITTVHADGIVSVLIQGRAPDRAQAQLLVAQTAQAVRDCLGPCVFGLDDETLPESLLTLLADRRLTLVTAESCTGGWVGRLITDVPGASQVYKGGWICYANDMKRDQLGVPQTLLDEHGAVSGPVAAAMAQQAADRSGADLAVAVTGLAGPEGGTEAKPVGTVWIATAQRCDGSAPTAPANPLQLHLKGSRPEIRDRAAKFALQAVRYSVLGQPLSLLAPPRPDSPPPTGPSRPALAR